MQAVQKAAAENVKHGAIGEEAQAALLAADKQLLDDFHQEVGRHVGLARISEHPKPR